MNVAYLAHGTGHGGAGASLILIVKSLKDTSIKKFLYVNRITRWKGIEEFFKVFKKVELIRVPSMYNDLAGGQTTLTEFEKIKSDPYIDFVSLLKEDGIDLLHINTSVFPHLHKSIKENTTIKIVTHVREMIPKYGDGEVQKFMIEQIFKYSDAIVCISDNEARPFAGHKHLSILPNPFDFNEIKNIKPILRDSYSLEKETVLIGMFGQFHKMKGQLLFLQILEHILRSKNAETEFKFVVIGCSINPLWKRILKKILKKPDYGSEFLTCINKYDLEKHVILVPYVSNIFEYVKDLDIVVRPSLSSDPWGRDIIESMAFGKPVVATGESEFYIKNGYNGFLVPNNDVQVISNKIIELMNNRNLREELGKNGLKLIADKCDVDKYTKEIKKIYEAICSQ